MSSVKPSVRGICRACTFKQIMCSEFVAHLSIYLFLLELQGVEFSGPEADKWNMTIINLTVDRFVSFPLLHTIGKVLSTYVLHLIKSRLDHIASQRWERLTSASPSCVLVTFTCCHSNFVSCTAVNVFWVAAVVQFSQLPRFILLVMLQTVSRDSGFVKDSTSYTRTRHKPN